MSETKRLAGELTKALNGEAWHGPSWREVLEGIGREAALHRPIPEAHTIAEIVLHATAWHDIVRKRLNGEKPEVTETVDWPKVLLNDDRAWTDVVTRLFETGRSLTDTVADFPLEKLHEKRAGADGTWYELISGELQHVLYHGGQVGLLKKARVPATV